MTAWSVLEAVNMDFMLLLGSKNCITWRGAGYHKIWVNGHPSIYSYELELRDGALANEKQLKGRYEPDLDVRFRRNSSPVCKI